MLQLSLATPSQIDVMIAAFSTNWLLNQLANNAVSVAAGPISLTYVKVADGSYNPPPGHAETLAVVSGHYELTTPQKMKYTFNSAGKLSTYVDPAGVTVTYGYDGSNRVTSVTNGLGRTLTLTYSGSRLASVADGNGRSVSYTVDSNSHLTDYVDADGETTTYDYASPGLLTELFLPANPTVAFVTNTFDSLGRVMEQVQANQGTYTFYFAGYRAEYTNPDNFGWVVYLNSFGSDMKYVDQLGNTTTIERDGLGREVSKVMPEGNALLTAYDKKNNVTSLTWQPKPGSSLANIVQSFTYDSTWNKVATATDGEGNQTTFTYDSVHGTLIQISGASITITSVTTITIGGAPPASSSLQTIRVAGHAATYLAGTGDSNAGIASALSTAINGLSLSGVSSSSSGADILLTAPVGTTLTATGLGGVTISSAIFVNVGYTYNSRGQVLTRTRNIDSNLAHNITDSFAYSGSNETLTSVTIDSGSGKLNLTTSFGYSGTGGAVGNVTSITDPRGKVTTIAWDDERRVTQVTDAYGSVTNYGYDENGNQTSIARQLGNPTPFQTWSFVYSEHNDLLSVTDPASNQTTFEYDNLRRLISQTDAENREWQFEYDALNRVIVVTDPLNQASQTLTYTDNGMTATVEDANTNVTEMQYDGLDRLDKRIYPDTSFEQFTFNKNSQVLTMETRAGNTITNTYDVLNRLATRQPGPVLGLQTMTYDLSSRMLKVSTPVVSGDPSTGDFQFSYDNANRLLVQTMPDSKTVSHSYQLDSSANRNRLTWPDGYYADYYFDDVYRLTNIKLNGSSSSAIVISYDRLSRRTGLTYENGATATYTWAINNNLTNLLHQFTGSSANFSYSYNNVNQVTNLAVNDKAYLWAPSAAGSVSYAAANELNQYPTVDSVSFGYSQNGNLTSGPFTSATFDAINRVTQVVSGSVTNNYWSDPLNRQTQKEVNSTKTGFLYDGVQLIAEYNSGGSLVNRYIPGTRLDEILVQVAAGTTTYLHQDRLGSTVAQTNTSGAVLNKYQYSPFGETPSLTGTIFGFTGQRYDSEIGQYNYIATMRSPRMIGFNPRDAPLPVLMKKGLA